MKKLYNCYYLSRSGSHAVRDWICNQIHFENKKNGHHHITLTGSCLDVMIENYERESLDANHKFLLTKKKQRLPEDRIDREKWAIIILRDPFNLFSSWSYHRLLKHTSPEDILYFKDMWKEHAREFAGETSIYNKKICINYNEWFISKDYRKIISHNLGGEFTDSGKNKLSLAGFGSSFDGRPKHLLKNAEKLKTGERWKHFFIKDKNDIYKNKFLYIFKDEELISLSERIFGHIDGTEQLYY